MKKTKIYFLAPLVVLIAFGAYYWNFKSDYDAKQAAVVAHEKEVKLEKLKQEAIQREAAIHDALEAQKVRKKEREDREAKELKQRDDKENAKLIEELQDRGEADPSLDPSVAAEALSWMVSRMAYAVFVLGRPIPIDLLTETLNRLWLNALRLGDADS